MKFFVNDGTKQLGDIEAATYEQAVERATARFGDAVVVEDATLHEMAYLSRIIAKLRGCQTCRRALINRYLQFGTIPRLYATYVLYRNVVHGMHGHVVIPVVPAKGVSKKNVVQPTEAKSAVQHAPK